MIHRPRAILDTSMVISRSLQRDSTSAKAFEAALFSATLLASTATLFELESTLRREKFDRYATLDDRLDLLNRYRKLVEVTEPSLLIEDCRDPKDNKFLTLALSAHADFLITGDHDLLSLHP